MAPKTMAIAAITHTQLSSGQGFELVGSSPPHGKSPPWAKDIAGNNNMLPDKIITDTIL